MDVAEAIKQRKSIRAFKPDPVPKDVLHKIIEQALRAPSWANTQPWEFMVVSGRPLKEIQEGFVARGMQDWANEVARINALAPKDRKDFTKEEMEERTIINFRHYGASTCIYLMVDKSIFQQSKGINVWSMYDSGSAVQNIMLLATASGLGTIAQAQAVVYPDIIRKVVKVPESKLLALGISVGYPDWDDPATGSRTAREPVDKVVTWYGFD